MTMAQYDMWSYDLNQDDTMTTQAVDMWLVRNGLAVWYEDQTRSQAIPRQGRWKDNREKMQTEMPKPVLRRPARMRRIPVCWSRCRWRTGRGMITKHFYGNLL